jgi:hypothetical protein
VSGSASVACTPRRTCSLRGSGVHFGVLRSRRDFSGSASAARPFRRTVMDPEGRLLADAAVERSRRRSAWPHCRAYSAICATRMSRSCKCAPSGLRSETPTGTSWTVARIAGLADRRSGRRTSSGASADTGPDSRAVCRVRRRPQHRIRAGRRPGRPTCRDTRSTSSTASGRVTRIRGGHHGIVGQSGLRAPPNIHSHLDLHHMAADLRPERSGPRVVLFLEVLEC